MKSFCLGTAHVLCARVDIYHCENAIFPFAKREDAIQVSFSVRDKVVKRHRGRSIAYYSKNSL